MSVHKTGLCPVREVKEKQYALPNIKFILSNRAYSFSAYAPSEIRTRVTALLFFVLTFCKSKN